MKLKLHIAFWVAVIAVLTILFGRYYRSLSESFYFVSMLLPVVVATCYFFNLYLVPRYLLEQRYFKFGLYSFYMLVISLYLEMIVIFMAFIFQAEYSYNNMATISSDVLVLAVTQYFIIFLFSFVLLVRRNFHSETAIGQLSEEKNKLERKGFTVRSDRREKTIFYDQVLYIESLANYVRIHMEGEAPVITKEKISSLQERLPALFVRIHRSFLVNKQSISSFNKEEVDVKGEILKISRTYKKSALEQLELQG